MKVLYFLTIVFIATLCGINDQSEEKTNSSKLASEDIDALSVLNLANNYYEQDNYKEAADGYKLAIKLDSTIGEAHYKLAYSLIQLDSDTFFIDSHPSTKHYIKSAELNYRPSEAYFNAAIIKSIFALDDSAAIELFNKSLETNPDQPEVYEMIEDAKKRLLERSGTNIKM